VIAARTEPGLRKPSADRTRRQGPVERVLRDAARRVARSLPLPAPLEGESDRGEPTCELRLDARGLAIGGEAILSCAVTQRPDVGGSFSATLEGDRFRIALGDAVEVHLGWSETGSACVLHGIVTGCERDLDERGGRRTLVHGLASDDRSGAASALVLRRGRDLLELRARMAIAAGAPGVAHPESPRALLDVFAYGAVEGDALALGAAALRPGATVELEGVGRRFEGAYVAGACRHAFTPGSYTTEITLSRAGPGAGTPEIAAARPRAEAAPRTFFAFLAEGGT
jgi:hypothetical protein